MAATSTVLAQRPYIGFGYPAGGQQGTTFKVKLGGQSLSDVQDAVVSGPGVTARVIEYLPRLGPIDMTLLRQQLTELRRPKAPVALAMASGMPMMTSGDTMMSSVTDAMSHPTADTTAARLAAKLEYRLGAYCNQPACGSLASLVFVEVTIAPDAPPGERELRLVTPRGGSSNPIPFHVGQLPEYCRRPMKTSDRQILGKENLALRNRPDEEAESRIMIPCTVNGQVASGEMNTYRFEARKGQHLIISVLARQLIPYIADAVPGWFQPVLALYDANGKELAYNDDYRFRPDPTIVYQVPDDGEYVLAINDAIYRGREDFVYRITIGEVPLITSVFPMGGRVGETHAIQMAGFNLDDAPLTPPDSDAAAGIHWIAASKKGFISNRVPFALDTLPEVFDKESNDTPERAQKVTLPVNVNGRIDKKDDRDVFEFTGKAGDEVVVEVLARRLDSPMDSVIKLTDATGKLLAFSDDHEDLGTGVNTHHADSYFMTKLPADGVYHVHVADTSGNGGEEYAYRLRISAPRPDFELRVINSSGSVRQKSTTAFSVIALRKDGYKGPIRLTLKNPPAGFTPYPVTMAGTQNVARLSFKADVVTTNGHACLTIIGSARIGDVEIARSAVPSEDRMQAFLWRHLVPAQDLQVIVYDPNHQIPRRVPPPLSPELVAKAKAVTAEAVAAGRVITKGQVAGRVRQLTQLYQEGLFTDDFYCERVMECGDPQ